MAVIDPQANQFWHLVVGGLGGGLSLLVAIFNWVANRQRKVELALEDAREKAEETYRAGINSSIETLWDKHDQLRDTVQTVKSDLDKLDGFCKARQGQE